MGKGKVIVKKGQNVKEGDLSGCMDEPHLHLNIAKIENEKVISIPYTSKLPEAKDKRKNLEKVVGILFIMSITISLIFISGITGML